MEHNEGAPTPEETGTIGAPPRGPYSPSGGGSGSQAGETANLAKEQGGRAAQTAKDEAGHVAGTAKEQTSHVAETAKDQAGQVAETAKEQAGRVAGEITEHGRTLVSQTTSQLQSQASEQTDRFAGALRQLGEQVRALAEGRTDETGQAGDYAKQAAETVSRLADRVESLGFEGVVREVQQFARRRSGVFLAGSAAAGFLIGRVARNVSGSSDGPTPQSGRQTPPSSGGMYEAPSTPPPAIPHITTDDISTGEVRPQQTLTAPALDPDPGIDPDPLATRPGGVGSPGAP